MTKLVTLSSHTIGTLRRSLTGIHVGIYVDPDVPNVSVQGRWGSKRHCVTIFNISLVWIICPVTVIQSCVFQHPSSTDQCACRGLWVVGYHWFFIRHVKRMDGVSKIFSPTSISGRISNNSRGTSNRGGISDIISSYPTPKIMLMLIQPHYEYELHKNRHTWTDQMWMIAAKQPFLHLL